MADEEGPKVRDSYNEAIESAKGGEGEERPVRERLEHAAISSQKGSPSPDRSDAEMQQEEGKATVSSDEKSRPAKKRSLEDLKEPEPGVGSLDAPATPSSGTHLRKKTREQKESEASQAESTDHHQPEDTLDDATKISSTQPAADVKDSNTPPPETKEQSPSGRESPRKKRSAEEMGDSAAHKPKVVATEEAQIARKSLDENRPILEPTSNGAFSTSSKQDAAKAATTAGFTGTSSSSPFASFGSKPIVSKQSDVSSAFASTGSASPFGAFGGDSNKSAFSSSSGFGSAKSPLASTSSGSDAPKLSFANAQSPFAGSSGFGNGAGGKLNSFASSKPDFVAPAAGPKLASFASPGGGDFKPSSGKLSNTFASPGGGDLASLPKGKPFGAPADQRSDGSGSEDEGDDDGESGAGADDNESRADELEKNTGPKVPPGEEEEETLFANRAKIYAFDSGSWKERGTGIFKLNIHRDSNLYPTSQEIDEFDPQQPDLGKKEAAKASNEDNGNPEDPEDPEAGVVKKAKDSKSQNGEHKTQARFIMRAMATHRMIINAPLFKEMLCGDPRDNTKPPVSKQMVFGIPEAGKVSLYLLKIGREDELANLYRQVKLLQRKL